MGLFGNILRGIGVGAGIVGAPFTGGASLPLALGLAGAGVAGGILSNTRGARTTESSGTRETTPILPPNVQEYLDNLLASGNTNLSRPLNMEDLALDEERLMSGLNQLDVTRRSRINQLSELQKENVSSSLASRGLSSSPGVVSNALATSEAFRGGQLADLSNNVANQRFNLIRGIEERRANLPILFENLLNDRLRTGATFLSGIPLGSRVSTTGTSVGPGSIAGGALQGGLTGYSLGGGFDGIFGRNNTNNDFDPSFGQGG